MRRLSLVSLGALSLALPSAAFAQDCVSALEDIAGRVSELPTSVPHEIPDQLQEMYDQASEAADSNPRQCLSIVARMDQIVRRYGGAAGTAGGSGNAGENGPSTGSQTADNGPQSGEPSAEQLAEQAAEERRQERLERATHDQAEDARAINAYADAFRAYKTAIHDVAKELKSPAAALSSIDRPLDEIVDISVQMENDVIVNDDVDVLHAKLEDAFRRVDELRKVVDREWKRFLESEKKRKQASEDPLELAPLGPSDDDLLAPLGDSRVREAREALERAIFAAKQVRNKIDPYLHFYQPFLDMKPGYKQAYLAAYRKHPVEQEDVRTKCDTMLPGACAQLIRTTNDRQKKELDSIFKTYVIPE